MLECHNEKAEILNMVENGDVVCITTNGDVKQNGCCVMGRGIARQFRDLFPGIDLKLGGYIQKYGNRCFQLGNATINNKTFMVVSLPVKHHWNEYADVTLICKSCEQLVEMANKFGYKKVWVPAPGCGNGKLRYETHVFPWISQILDDRFICVRR